MPGGDRASTAPSVCRKGFRRTRPTPEADAVDEALELFAGGEVVVLAIDLVVTFAPGGTETDNQTHGAVCVLLRSRILAYAGRARKHCQARLRA